MFLPDSIQDCIVRLENAGFAAYAVGGCVRDAMLGLVPHDYDLCTAATPEQIKQIFSHCRLLLSGEKHGTVTVLSPSSPIEITTFRQESGYRDCRHPDRVRFVTDIESDLSRRDFTINAMAYSPTRGLADPFGGRNDLLNRRLRTVGDAQARFQEDALRILRGVRFAVRFRLEPEQATFAAMLSQRHLLDCLAAERIFSELCKLIVLITADDLLRYAPILGQIIPELQATFGFDQRSPHHAFDLYTHIAHVTAAVPNERTVRLAALLHDIGKPDCFTLDETGRGHFYGHARVSAEKADLIARRLKAPTVLREQVKTLIALHMTPLEPDRRLLRRRLSQYGMTTVRQLLQLQQADFTSKGVTGQAPPFAQIRAMLDTLENTCLRLSDLAIDGHDLLEMGFPQGRFLGQCLNWLLAQVISDHLPNTRQALLSAAAGRLAESRKNS